MNFLNVIHYPVFGGPHNRACRLNSTLDRRGFKTLVLLPQETGNASESLKKAEVPLVKIPLHRARATLDIKTHLAFFSNFWRDINTIRDIISNRKIGFVLISGLANPHGAIAGALEGIPVVWQITDSRTPLLLRLILLPLVKRFADSVMFNGSGLVQFHKYNASFDVPFFVYYPPVDTNSFRISSGKSRRIRQSIGLPENARVVGMVANINPKKGIEYFIRAASVIYRKQPDCYFVVIGARYETHLKYNRLIEDELSLSAVPRERFIFTGEKMDIENYYPVMDVKLITSIPYSEGTTTTAMEAMACGIPVVATDVGSVREVVKNGVTGFVVPPLNSEAIARATVGLLQDHHLRQKMSGEARRQAVECYDVEACADTHVSAFEAALANHLQRRPRFKQIFH